MSLIVGTITIFVIFILFVTAIFGVGKKVDNRSGDDPITYDDYVELMCKLDEIQEAIEGDKG